MSHDEVIDITAKGGLSRRQMLCTTAATGAAIAAVQVAEPAVAVASASTAAPNPSASDVIVDPIPAEAEPGAPSGGPVAAEWLMRRLSKATFGVTNALILEVRRGGGFEAWVDQQIAAPHSAPTGDWAPLAAATEKLLADADARIAGLQIKAGFNSIETRRMIAQGLVMRTVLHATYGTDQLRQRLVSALTDLLHVSISTTPTKFLVPSYDTMIRDMAFGRYEDLLMASAKHPAMLLYLNLHQSRADGTNIPNENYARELLELHTVGVDGGYDEQDVLEVAYVLSGWAFNATDRTFNFVGNRNQVGPLATGGDVLGWRPPHPNAVGNNHKLANGESLIRHLAHHPSTAKRIAHTLVRRFVGEHVPAHHPIVADIARAYLEADTNLGATVKAVLMHPDFDRYTAMMMRRPIDLIASTLRRGRATFTTTQFAQMATIITGLLTTLNQVPYQWDTPDGYPWSSRFWTNPGSMVARANALTTLVNTHSIGVKFNWNALGGNSPTTTLPVLCQPDSQLF